MQTVGESLPQPEQPEKSGVSDAVQPVTEEAREKIGALSDPVHLVTKALGLEDVRYPVAEDFRSETWLKLRKPGDFHAMTNAAKAGIPEKECRQFAQFIAIAYILQGRIDTAFRFLLNTKTVPADVVQHLGQQTIDGLFEHYKRPELNERFLAERLGGTDSDLYKRAVERLQTLPVETFDEDAESDENEDAPERERIQLSLDIPMRELWNVLFEQFGEEGFEDISQEIADTFDTPENVLLQVDSKFMDMSVREFCSTVHLSGNNKIEIPLDMLIDCLGVDFTD